MSLPQHYRLGASALQRSQMLLLLGLMLVLFALPAAFLIMTLADQGEDPWVALAQAWRDYEPGFREWTILILLVLAALYWAILQRARLRLTPSGLELQVSPLTGLGLEGFSTGQHRLGWSEIRQARLVPQVTAGKAPVQLRRYRLSLETDRGTVHLGPFNWVSREGPDHRLVLADLFRMHAMDIEERVRNTPLVQALVARGVAFTRDQAPGEAAAGSGLPGYNLLRHGGMVAQLGVLLAGAGYFLAELFLLVDYQPLGTMPWRWYPVVALLALLAAYHLGRGAPQVERIGVGAPMALALTAAVYPAQIRLNVMTAGEPRVVSYRQVEPGLFQAGDSRYPRVDLRDRNLAAYWESLPASGQHEFHLLKGSLDFPVLDLGPVYEKTRAFYRSQATEPEPR